MALKKKIELINGIIVNYHRIVSINKITNATIIIEVASYVSEEKRQEEIENRGLGTEMGFAMPTNIFIETTYLNKEYVEDEDIKDIYDYLKTTEKFMNAEDV